MITKIENIINTYKNISLVEINSVALMKRTDTKFVIHQNQLLAVLKDIKIKYKVLEINQKRLMSYESLYFDTESMKFYYDHHNGKPKRTKIRMRKYVDSGLCFLEIKQKDGKGNTNKSRIKIDDFEYNLSESSMKFIKETTLSAYKLAPIISNKFIRITLVNKKNKERVTIDLNLSFKTENTAKSIDNLAIIEIKQERINRNSPIVKALKFQGIHPYRLSKYCIGMISTYKDLKYNAFKQKILKINKLTA